jgi:adenine phosphoribosyltransferase
LIDDVLATGGTISAALDLIGDVGGIVQVIAVLIEFTSLKGRELITGKHQGSLEALLQV